jgi:predicted nucleic acid-binding Zn ribbon protein
VKNSNDSTLGDAIKLWMKSNHVAPKMTAARIESSWESIVGKSVASYTEKVKVKDSTLIITISSPSLRQELHFGKEKLLQIVNDFLGEEYIKTIILR